MTENTMMHIEPLPERTLSVPIIGTTPLIMHKFTEKAKRQMLDDMQGKKAKTKEPRDPVAEYEAAMYTLKDGRPGMPILAFKAATVGAARFYDKSVTMVGLRQAMFFRGEPADDGLQQLVAIEGDPEMREDVVRYGRSSTDLRYRPMFREWSAVLEISTVAAMLSDDSVVSLVDAGGLGIGVGEWRPEKNGEYGTYRVDPTRNVEVIGR